MKLGFAQRQAALAGVALLAAVVSLAVTSLGAACGETLAYSASGLPPGLSVSRGGTISGRVTTAAAPGKSVTYRVTLSVKNAAGATAAAAFSWSASCNRSLVPGWLG